MRYSHALRKYHNQTHNLLSIGVFALSIISIFSLIFLSRSNYLVLTYDLLISTWRVMLAYLITLPLAVFAVIVITRRKSLEDFFVPILDVSQSIPTFAFLPLMISVYGRGTPTIVAFLIIEMIWPIIFTTLSGIKTVREELNEAAAIFQAKGVKKLIYFTLPALFPSIVTGSIVGWGEAWETIVGAELIVGKNGIGAFIGKTYDSGNTFVFTITVLLLLIFIFTLNRLIWLPLLKRSTQFQTE
ncbi:ABC transporter permease subunit [Candidatus Curtissbacteria bacterium]|nr:ABC transporter permease subunit [Candidatus Curtissbacteria bacterium]